MIEFWTRMAATVWIQSAVIVGVALLAARATARFGAVAQSLVLRVALVGVLVCVVFNVTATRRAMPITAWWNVSLPQPVLESASFESAPISKDNAPTQSAPEQDATSANALSSTRSSADDPNESVFNDRANTNIAPHDEAVSATTNATPSSAPAASLASSRSALSFSNVYAVVLAIWITGTGAILLSMLWGAFQMALLLRSSTRVVDTAWRDELRLLCAQMSVREPRLLQSEHARSPFLVGLWRPAIVLPRGDFDSSARRFILCHELTHLGRHDLRWNTLLRVANAVLWTQPLMWKLCRTSERLSEDVCDAAVVESGASRQQYAQCLFDLAQRWQPSRAERNWGAGVVPMRSNLGQRVQNILSSRETTMKISTKLRVAIAVAMLGAVGLSLRLVAVEANEEVVVPSRPNTSFVTGRVVYEDGRPAAGVYVSLQATDRVASNRSYQQWFKPRQEAFQRLLLRNSGKSISSLRKEVLDLSRKWRVMDVTRADGTFRLAGFSSAQHDVLVTPDGYKFQATTALPQWVASAAQATTAPAGKTAPVKEIVLTRGAIIRGRVLDRATKRPLQDVYVYSYGPHRPRRGSATMSMLTDKNGNYALRVAPGTSSLFISGNRGITATIHYETSPPYPNKAINVIRNGGALYSPSSWIETQLDNTQPRLQRVGASSGAVEVATVKGQTRTLDFRLDKLVTKKLPDGLHVYIPAKPFVKPPQNNNASNATSSTRSVDLSSPQNTLRTFVNAINSKNGAQLVSVVEGAASANPAVTSRLFTASMYVSVRDVRVQRQGERAVVTMLTTAKLRSPNGNRDERSVSRLEMQRRDGVWKIVPRTMSGARGKRDNLLDTVNLLSPLNRNEVLAWAKGRGKAEIVGRVVREDGKPAANVRLSIQMFDQVRFKSSNSQDLWMTLMAGNVPISIRNLFSQSVQTDDNGNFRIRGFTSTRYRLTAQLSSRAMDSDAPLPEFVAVNEPTVAAREGSSTRSPDIVLKRGNVINVEVLDDVTNKPLPKIFILADTRNGANANSPSSFDTTDAQGRAQFRVARGNIHLWMGVDYPPQEKRSVVKSGGRFYNLKPQKVLLNDTSVPTSSGGANFNISQDANVQIRLKPYVAPVPKPTPPIKPLARADGVMTGRVVYENGKPAAGIRVVAAMQKTARWEVLRSARLDNGDFSEPASAKRWAKVRGRVEQTTTTRQDGTFRFNGLTTAPYNIFVDETDERMRLRATPAYVAVAVEGAWARGGQIINRVQPLVLTRGALVQSRMLRDVDGRPLNNMTLVYYGPQNPESSESAIFIKTNANGRFKVRLATGKTQMQIVYNLPSRVQYQLDNGAVQSYKGFRGRIKIDARNNQNRVLTIRLRRLERAPQVP